MTAARSIGPAMLSGSRSVGETCTRPGLPLAGIDGGAGIAPVMSAGLIGEAAACGIASCALSSLFGAAVLFDCLPIGVGEVIDGAAGAGIEGAAPVSAGESAGGGAWSSIAGIGGALPMSSSVIAILKVPSTITTTLTPTSSERIFDVMVERSWPAPFASTLGFALSLALPPTASLALNAVRAVLSSGALAAAACAARRAAAMKLDVLTGSFGPVEISLIALSDAAIRSEGDDVRAAGRVPGSSG